MRNTHELLPTPPSPALAKPNSAPSGAGSLTAKQSLPIKKKNIYICKCPKTTSLVPPTTRRGGGRITQSRLVLLLKSDPAQARPPAARQPAERQLLSPARPRCGSRGCRAGSGGLLTPPPGSRPRPAPHADTRGAGGKGGGGLCGRPGRGRPLQAASRRGGEGRRKARSGAGSPSMATPQGDRGNPAPRRPEAGKGKGWGGYGRRWSGVITQPVSRRVRGVPARSVGGRVAGGGRPHLLSFNTSSSSAQLSHIVH